MKIAVIGTGYVGLVTGGCLAEMGNHVTCIDIDAVKVKLLSDGVIPFYEPGLQELVRTNLLSERLTFSSDLTTAVAENDILFIAVGTPSNPNGMVDLSCVWPAIDTIAQNMNGPKYVVIKSTVPVGTCFEIRERIQRTLQTRNLNLNFYVISNPEFLKEGSAILDFMKPDRIVIGCDEDITRNQLHDLYHPFVLNGHRIIKMDTRSAELTKYAANAQLATKISLMNELAQIAESLGADINAVRQGIGSDPRIGPHFIYAGIGYGGSCFPKDVKALIQSGEEQGLDMSILKAVEKVNVQQRSHFVNKLKDHFGSSLSGRKIAVWGLSFKPETDDLREAPSIDIIRVLMAEKAFVHGYDPAANPKMADLFKAEEHFHIGTSQYEVLQNADALLLCTEWKPFRSPDFTLMKRLMNAPLIFDGRNQFEPELMKSLGFGYFSIGRPAIPLP